MKTSRTGVKSTLAFALVATGLFLVAAAGASAQACEHHNGGSTPKGGASPTGGASPQGGTKNPVPPLVHAQPAKGTVRDHRASAQPVAPRTSSRDAKVRDHTQPAKVPQARPNLPSGGPSF